VPAIISSVSMGVPSRGRRLKNGFHPDGNGLHVAIMGRNTLIVRFQKNGAVRPSG
jgi:hypothetical protein